MHRIALAAFALCLLPVSPLLAADGAQEKDDICAAWDKASDVTKSVYKGFPRKDACRGEYWNTFEAKPAAALFDAGTYAAYQQALEREECDAAMDLLAPAFVRAYPRAPDIGEGRRTSEASRAEWVQEALKAKKEGKPIDRNKDRERILHHMEMQSHFIAWTVRVLPGSYPEMAFCNAMQKLKAAQNEIASLGLDAPRYGDLRDALHHPSRQYPAPVDRRNGAIGELFNLSDRYRYVPASLALLELSQQGQALRFVPAYQYYFLNYLVAHADVPAARVADMLAAAAEKLPDAKRRELDEQARLGEYKEPLPIND